MQPDWQTEDGSIQLYRGDCLKILPTIEAGSVDAVVTDPPYGKKTHAGARSMSKGGSRRGHNRIDFASTTAGMIRSSLGMIQPRRWCVSFIDWRHALSLEQEPPKGLEFVRLLFPTHVGVNRSANGTAPQGNPYSPRMWG
jgi:site-specific DNA-methyltransferase (adenine-specific)